MKRHASHPRANRESWGEKKGRFLTRDSETRARRSLITARDTGRYTACWLLYDTFRDHGITQLRTSTSIFKQHERERERERGGERTEQKRAYPRVIDQVTHLRVTIVPNPVGHQTGENDVPRIIQAANFQHDETITGNSREKLVSLNVSSWKEESRSIGELNNSKNSLLEILQC